MKINNLARGFLFAASLCGSMTLHAQTWSLNSDNPAVKWYVAPAGAAYGSPDTAPPAPEERLEWTEATVPGTVFAAYVDAGKEKDPNFGDNIHQVDRSKYDREYWYRTEFEVPAELDKELLWLNFRGINRKGTIFLNGTRLGELDGFMHRGRFDVTKIVRRSGNNTLAVLVDIPRGSLGNNASPTYICSAGWDWMPYVPGLNSGITDKVYLSTSNALTLADPWIRSELPSTARADVSIRLGVRNDSERYASGEVRGVIMPGDIRFSTRVNVEPGRTAEVRFDKSECPALSIDDPLLWWPNGYGEPNLYTCDLTVEIDGKPSDTQRITFGLKKYDYDTKDGVFHLWINDRRIFVKGANWGLSEYMLRCRGEEYFTKVRLHKEMNFNMIRNWLGTTTDEEFYEACDKYGIMVWDDFWLNSNPILPDDIHAFNYNAVEKIKRLRNHPSIAVWCGNNEGWPEPPLDTYLRENVRVFDGGERYYQSNSHEGHLSGSGPWGAYDPRYYFTYYPYPYNKVGTPGWGFRTEIGTAVFVNAESFCKFIPEDKLWPRNEMWNLHYFGQQAFNGLPDQYERMLNERYGKAADIDDFCRKAQLLNIESNQALYEGWLDHMWEDASGIMTWMGQSAYPSLVWQTYDYYYDLTGAYWGCKRACEPLHILWNPVTNDVKITNTTSQTYEGLTATAEVFNTDGRRVDALTGTATVNSAPNTALRCFTIPFYKNVENIARGKRVVASSTDAGSPEEIVDGSEFTRWGSRYSDHEWIYIDLGSRMNVYGVGLNWENAFGKEFKIQISDDAEHWTDAAHERTGKAGKQDIFFDDVKGRYVKVQGIRRGTGYGYSLYEMKVYGGEEHQAGLSDVHLIRLTLRDAEGRGVDRNTYWRGLKRTDFTALNTLPAPRLKVQQKGRTEGGKYVAEVKVTNLASSPAVSFATWVQLRHPRSGERILPALYDDNYFMLLPGETQTVHVEFDKELLGDAAQPVVSVTPYNDGR